MRGVLRNLWPHVKCHIAFVVIRKTMKPRPTGAASTQILSPDSLLLSRRRGRVDDARAAILLDFNVQRRINTGRRRTWLGYKCFSAFASGSLINALRCPSETLVDCGFIAQQRHLRTQRSKIIKLPEQV